MSHLTLDVEELRNRWMRFYLNIMILRSTHPEVETLMKPIKETLAETNEKLITFFDALEKPLEAEG